MLLPGQAHQGYKVLIVHVDNANPFIGTVLMRANKTDFRVATVNFSTETSVTDDFVNSERFGSYTHALARFHKIVDEEAFQHDSW